MRAGKPTNKMEKKMKKANLYLHIFIGIILLRKHPPSTCGSTS